MQFQGSFFSILGVKSCHGQSIYLRTSIVSNYLKGSRIIPDFSRSFWWTRSIVEEVYIYRGHKIWCIFSRAAEKILFFSASTDSHTRTTTMAVVLNIVFLTAIPFLYLAYSLSNTREDISYTSANCLEYSTISPKATSSSHHSNRRASIRRFCSVSI